jgi:hypothetical protein
MPACGATPFNFPGDFALTSDQAVTCPACLALVTEPRTWDVPAIPTEVKRVTDAQGREWTRRRYRDRPGGMPMWHRFGVRGPASNAPERFLISSFGPITELRDQVACLWCDCLPAEQQPECHGCACHGVNES